MKLIVNQYSRSARILTGLLVPGTALVWGQTATEPRPQMAEEVFKNIQTFKGVPVNQFLGIMGFFSAALGKSCVDCHDSDSGWENYVSDNNPNKKIARSMVGMVNALNRTSFGGRQVVTCYSCHRGGPSPQVTPDLTALYSPPVETASDVIKTASGGPSAEQILDKYIEAIGGVQAVAALSSYSAKGSSVGYGLDSEKRAVEIYAKAPGQRTSIVHAPEGDFTTVFDGRAGWIAAPNLPVPVLPLTGGDLDGAKLDAELAFPVRIKQSLAQWRAGFGMEIDDQEVQVIQGRMAAGDLATLYFDSESGLLTRLVRYANSPVGRMPTRTDYSDYRPVAGVKMPFKWTVTWLDGRESFELTSVQPNATIDAGRFGKPAGSPAPAK